jgi:hypothetical protein
MTRLMKGWEVEWCKNVPVDKESGDADIDRADMHCRDFATKEQAMAFAKKKLPEDWFGSVRVTEFALEPFEPGYPGLTKEYVGQTEYIEV